MDNISFRGQPIPDVKPKANFKYADSQQVIDKIKGMSPNELKNVTIDSVHFDDKGLDAVKLTTNDIVPVETAIALAKSNMLSGYSTGATMRGGRTLRAKPDPDNKILGVHELPTF